LALGGTAEAVPFPFVEKVRSFRSAEALRHPKSAEAWFSSTAGKLQIPHFVRDDKQ